VFAIAWWGLTIASAIEDDDDESRQQLDKATGLTDAWRSLSVIGPANEADWAELLEGMVADPLGWVPVGPPDPVLDAAYKVLMALALAIREDAPAGRPS